MQRFYRSENNLAQFFNFDKLLKLFEYTGMAGFIILYAI